MKLQHFLLKLRQLLVRTEAIFFLLSVPAILIFVYIIPPSWGLDEQVHTARVYQITDGGLYPAKLGQPHEYGGTIPVDLKNVLHDGWATGNNLDRKDTGRQSDFYGKDRQDRKYGNDVNKLGKKPINSKKQQEYNFGPTGPYSPLVYMPAAAGMSIARVFNTNINTALTLAKLTQAIFYVVSVFAALWFLRKSNMKWLVFCIALLPINIFQVATINADSFTTAAMLLFVSVIYSVFTQRRRISQKKLAVILIASILLVSTKPSYAVALGLLLFLPAHGFKDAKDRYIKIGAIFSTGLILFLITSLKGLQYSDSILMYFTPEMAAKINLKDQILWILHSPLEFMKVITRTYIDNTQQWLNGIYGVFGYNTVRMPYVAILPAISALILSVMYEKKLSQKIGALFVAAGCISGLSVVLLLYVTFNTIGAPVIAGIQGRYFIPSLALIAFGGSAFLGIKLQAHQRFMSITSILGMTLSLYVAVLVYATALY